MVYVLWTVPVILTILLGLPPLWLTWRSRRSHIRKLWARIEPVWESGERNGGWLILTNGSEWPAWNILVMAPEELDGTDFESVGPGEIRRLYIPEQKMGSIIDNVVTIQIEDIRQKLWIWTPIAQTLSPIPPPIPLLAKIIQFLVKELQDRQRTNFHTRLLSRLPHGLVVLLWGYDPMGVETDDYFESHLRRAKEKLSGEDS